MFCLSAFACREYADGDFIINDYTLDSEKYALSEYKERCIHKDGSEDLLCEIAVTYDVQRPKIAQDMMERSNPETDFRTLTVVLDPNTEQEKGYSRKVKKGELFSISVPEGYEFYKDEACTIVDSDEIDPNAHVLIYSKAADTYGEK